MGGARQVNWGLANGPALCFLRSGWRALFVPYFCGRHCRQALCNGASRGTTMSALKVRGLLYCMGLGAPIGARRGLIFTKPIFPLHMFDDAAKASSTVFRSALPNFTPLIAQLGSRGDV